MKTLLALGAGGVSLSYWQAFAGDAAKIAAPAGAATEATFDVFTALSCLVTLRERLDPETTKRMYKVFMGEPWAPDHIVRVYNKLRGALGDQHRASLKDASWQFDEGEKWFAGHLLTTWYLGVYYHENQPPQRVAYETALMFDPIRGLLPIPLVESLGYGGWTAKPEGEQ